MTTSFAWMFFSQLNRDKAISHLVQAAISGMSLHQIINSELIKSTFKKNGWNLPSSQTSLKNKLIEISKQVKLKLKNEIHELKSNGEFFSVALDEWTSISNVRFMNVYLTFHGGSYNLGLQELTGSLTSEALMNFLSMKLADFDLDIKDIIGITSDGASVMLKLQKSVDCFSQICLAHGIHLSVKDSLISEDKEPEFLNLQSSSDDEDESIAENDIYNVDCNSCVTKMIKVINRFSHSGLLVDKLRHYRETAEKKPLKIITHTKTRWNSLYLAIERFLILWPEIQKVFIDISADIELCLNQDEINQLANIRNTLMPVYICTTALCRENVNLFEADKILNFCLTEISKLRNPFSTKFLKNLNKRVVQRRNKTTTSLLAFLNSKNTREIAYLNYLTKEETKNELIKFYNKIFGYKISQCNRDEPENAPEQINDKDIDDFERMQQKLIIYLDSDSSRNVDNLDIESAIDLHSCGTINDKRINLMAKAMLSIQPTSVNPERAFSMSGFFCIKVRNRMFSIA